MSVNAVKDIKDGPQLTDLIVGDGLLVVHFAANQVQQCVDVNEVLTELAKRNASVRFAKVIAEDIPEITNRLKVTSVPTCIFLLRGKELGRVEGADIPQITSKVKTLAAQSGGADHSHDNNTSNIENRLKALINRAPVMIFMKGCPEAPRCGFSRTLISILEEINAKYETFDILGDEEVRQSLKEYSKWPTYPQVYVKGSLIGGLDIIKELKEMGELEDALKG